MTLFLERETEGGDEEDDDDDEDRDDDGKDDENNDEGCDDEESDTTDDADSIELTALNTEAAIGLASLLTDIVILPTLPILISP